MTREAEVNDVLRIDLPVAIPRMVELRKLAGREAVEIDWPCGLMLRVNERQALVFVSDPTPEIVQLLEDSGRSFCVQG